MLVIDNLVASIDDKQILNGLNLTVNAGEVHAIMGPNGAGKSTLGNVLAGRDGYEVDSGSITLDGNDLLELDPEVRASAGLFLAFQYPVEIPGISNMEFLKTAINSIRTQRGQDELDAVTLLKQAREACKAVNLPEDFLKRGVNEGFSGGEKKRNEILQMILLQPKLCVLDETDSGLDIDALKTVAEGVNKLRDTGRAFIIVTHYQRLLDHIVPDVVHIMNKGEIVRTGDKTLAKELEAKGYTGVV